jgi:23S rRNA pseudouridine2605 synthase
MPERLQKWLAGAGLGSRREIEGWIAAGRITVNGRPAALGCVVSGTETITLDGKVLRGLSGRRRAGPRVLVYHKPVGEVATRSDPEGRPTVFGALPPVTGGRWISVGRLDVDTAGLLLFTTDGELAHRLMHPSSELVREYAVRVRGQPAAADLERLRTGVELEDGRGRFDSITDEGGEGSNHWYRVTVAEGRNRIVRRLWESVGSQVSRLIRVRFGPLSLPRQLRRGAVRELVGRELATLYEAVDLAPPAGAYSATRPGNKVNKTNTINSKSRRRLRPGSRGSAR